VTVFIPDPPGANTSFQHPGVSTYIDFGGSDNLVTYYTPRFWGFQLGVSYAPTLALNGDGKNFPVEADTETEYHNGFAVGLNFVEDFNGFGVAISGGWRYASVDDTRGDAPAGESADDYQAVSVGLQLSYAGFTVGGSYANEFAGMASCDTSSCATTTTFVPTGPGTNTAVVTPGGIQTSTEGYAWDVGVTYNLGPWTFGVTYFEGHVEDRIDDPDDDEMWAIQGGLYYALGPGITLGAGVMYADWTTEEGVQTTGVAAAAGLGFSF
jgi:predicted porin